MNLCLVSMSHIFSRAINAVFNSKCLRISLAGLLLSGCVTHAPTSAISNKPEEKLPEHQLADFLSTDCNNIWQLQGHETETNPLYWLRSMDCAERLAPSVARAEARNWADDSWQGTFKRGILLANAKISPVERRAWRDGQMQQLQLAEERSRYSKLQQASDEELDTLRQQQQYLRGELETTTRKLENLTDIERQLSTRKPVGDMPKSEEVKP